MSDQLVTIASFEDATQARVALEALEAAGIKAALTDGESMSLFGGTPALAGFQLLVRGEDTERAGLILDEAFDPENVDEEELAAQAEAAGTEERPAEAPPVTLQDRERDAGTAFATALIGLLIPIVIPLFTIPRILSASSGPGRLGRRARVYLFVAGTIAVLWSFLLLSALFLLRSSQ